MLLSNPCAKLLECQGGRLAIYQSPLFILLAWYCGFEVSMRALYRTIRGWMVSRSALTICPCHLIDFPEQMGLELFTLVCSDSQGCAESTYPLFV